MSEQNRILFSTDFSEESLAALPWAKRMGESLNAEIHCVTAVQDLVPFTPMMAIPVTLPDIEDLGEQAQGQLNELVQEHLSGAEKSPIAKVLKGRPADEIAKYANEINATMIVMATHGRSGVAHMFMGSTAEGVLRQAECPVLTVPVR